jgi:pimeloyl-ACP methyl ester carboxylesterase
VSLQRKTRHQVERFVTVIGAILIAFQAQHLAAQSDNRKPVEFAEQVVHVQTKDDIVDSGVLFTPPKDEAKPIAIIWIHGWGVNFYFPTYVGIGRALAKRGYTTITANTRMHDIGNVEAWRGEKRVRGGGYWGVPSEQTQDLGAWADLAERLGFKKVILVGHSDGWAAVRRYQWQTQDSRVAGLVLASGPIDADTGTPDADQIAQAKQMMADGQPEDLVKDSKRSFPSFVSAATLLDIINTPPELKDFFGVRTANPGVTRVHCPLLALFGTNGDVGGEKDLELLKGSIKRQLSGPSSVKTALIEGAAHMYAGEEDQVAQVIAKWADTLLLANRINNEVPSRP